MCLKKIFFVHILQWEQECVVVSGDGAELTQENKAALRQELDWTVCSTAQIRLSYKTIPFKCPLTQCYIVSVLLETCSKVVFKIETFADKYFVILWLDWQAQQRTKFV